MSSIVINCYYWFPVLNNHVKVVSWTRVNNKYGCYISNDPYKRRINVDTDVAESCFVHAPDFNPELLDYSYDLFYDIKYLSDFIRGIKKGFVVDVEEIKEFAQEREDLYLLSIIKKYEDWDRKKWERYC